MRKFSAEGGNAAFRGPANWLCLAATPTFAIMALPTGIFGGNPLDMLCMGSRDASPLNGPPLNGMTTMYMLMAVFHAAPWLKLIG